MTDVLTPELTQMQREEQTQCLIERFVRRFEPAYYELVCHAALPLVLTPELVSYLRNEFLPGLPWIAEVDLLLSDLCSQVGYELYVMDMDVRAYALKAKSETFGAARMKEVANLLISYVRYLANNSSQMSSRELESQQWAAMVYLGAEAKQQVVDKIAERFQACSSGGMRVGGELLSRAEMAQLADITQNFREQLADYPALIEYASLVSDVQLRNIAVAEERIARVYEVGSRQLQLPAGVKEALKVSGRIRDTEELSTSVDTTPPTARPSDVQPVQDAFLAFPTLEELRFFHGELVDGERPSEHDLLPPLKTAIFQIATVGLPQQPLEIFEFQSAKIEQERAGLFRRLQWVVKKSRAQARRFAEPLADDLTLEMVAISGGTFLMGSPESEPERSSSESPQHEVTVPDFFIGRYPVTQAQWRFVANLPQANRELKPEPSSFKDDLLPVENVSWYDATEFCDRISVHTDRTYRLPTEAEWEYACRAGTTTPFHFGDMILPEVANYNGNFTYANGPKGKNREKTTSVNEFDVANAFGLSDTHGNVWEWCQDHWHENYEGAPTDGSAGLTNNKEANRLLRGGSWVYDPRDCRSAYRDYISPVNRYYFIGFRVSCSAPRT